MPSPGPPVIICKGLQHRLAPHLCTDGEAAGLTSCDPPTQPLANRLAKETTA
jgi:hypothetical protein